MKKFILLLVLLLVVALWLVKMQQSSIPAAPQRFWDITAVDTVKYSRDSAGDKEVLKEIPILVGEAAKLHVTHIAIDTPYDEEFYPVLKAWVDEARKDNLKVWFRGNFSSWEEWFGRQPFTDYSQHHVLTKAFIEKHPELFEDGDIFTPIPEPENGGPGDPRGSDQKSADFNAFLIASYSNCVDSFAAIEKAVQCGFFSTNGDIAKNVLTPETVARIGNVVVIDHYVDSPEKMRSDISYLSSKFPTAKIVLGEFGAPIPDINGDMNDQQQSEFIGKLLQVFYDNREKIAGINYWTLAGGSTALLHDDFSEKEAFTTLANYFLPSQLKGRVTDTSGYPLGHIKISNKSGVVIASTSQNGSFSIAAQKSAVIPLLISVDGYKPFEETIIVGEDHQELQDIQLQPVHADFIYKIKQFFSNLLSF
jgi:hypothetical protein